MAGRMTHEWFTPAEAAAYLGVSPATIRRWAKEGRLRLRPVSDNGHATVCHRAELQRLTNTQLVKPKRKRQPVETPEQQGRREPCERLDAFREQTANAVKDFDVFAVA